MFENTIYLAILQKFCFDKDYSAVLLTFQYVISERPKYMLLRI